MTQALPSLYLAGLSLSLEEKSLGSEKALNALNLNNLVSSLVVWSLQNIKNIPFFKKSEHAYEVK